MECGVGLLVDIDITSFTPSFYRQKENKIPEYSYALYIHMATVAHTHKGTKCVYVYEARTGHMAIVKLQIAC